jgi:hypothetical protein
MFAAPIDFETISYGVLLFGLIGGLLGLAERFL